MGVEYLSAVLKKEGHEAEAVFDPRLFNDSEIHFGFLAKLFDYKNKIICDVIESKPDLIIFSVVSDYYKWACEIAKELKQRTTIPIIFGGIHTTSVPKLVLKNDFVDMVCVGDGELSLKNLVTSMAKEDLNYKIKGIWFKKREDTFLNK